MQEEDLEEEVIQKLGIEHLKLEQYHSDYLTLLQVWQATIKRK
jgi:hypothetical protein